MGSSDPQAASPQHGRVTADERPPPTPRPGQIVIGKAHPVRDLIVLVVALVLGVLVASGISNGNKKTPKVPKDKPTNVKKEDVFTSSIKTLMETRYRSKDCDIFLHHGKIPFSGLSLYAGRKYGMDDVLFTNMPMADGFPLLGHIIKPHPTLSNVKFVLTDSGNYSLHVTKAVTLGTEFFQSFKDDLVLQHPDTYHSTPTEDDYQLAYEIAQELPYSNPSSDKRNRYFNRQPGYTTIQRHVRKAIAKLNPRIAHLLSQAPGDPTQNIPEMFLRRQTTITRIGTCVETRHVKNRYQAGEIVAQIPLHHLLKGKNIACPTVLYGSSYCGIVSSIATSDENHPPNVKLQWQADSDNHRPLLQALATRAIPPNTIFLAEPISNQEEALIIAGPLQQHTEL